MTLKPYPETVDAEEVWANSLPAYWDIKPVKYLFNIGRGRVLAESAISDEGQYPVYSSQTLNDGCMGFIDTYDFDCNQLTWTTDGANAGTVFIRSGKHNCTNVCGTLLPYSTVDLDIGYYFYALGNIAQYHKRPDTNGAKIMNGEMAAIRLPYPSLAEQKSITSFLDYETGKLDTLSAKHEHLIELLQEKRQALISHVVTKGLKPTVLLKDSGVVWLGMVPENWHTVSLKWVSKIYSGGTPDKTNESFWTDGTIPWINSGSVNQDVITEPSSYITEEAYTKSSAKWIPKNSLVIALAGQGKTKGMVAQLAIETTCNQSMAAIIPTSIISSRFLFWWLKANYQNIRNLAGGDLRDGLNLELIGDIPCPLLSLGEQDEISKYLDIETARIESLIEKSKHSIELAKEHRIALISAAITGKIDVREAA